VITQHVFQLEAYFKALNKNMDENSKKAHFEFVTEFFIKIEEIRNIFENLCNIEIIIPQFD
jgi:hypothetical protein